jgi:sentrin-specific protease 7
LNPQDIRKILIYPQGKGGISIDTESYMCLAIDQYLNDVIIDFYLNYLRLEVLKESQKEKTHVFNTFFYMRLTNVPRQKAMQGDRKLTAAQKRHKRVKNWTKHVNLFDKEFIIIPILEQSHWFLAIICYPGLMGPVTYDTGAKVKTPLPIIKKKRKSQMFRNRLLVNSHSVCLFTASKKQMSLQIGNTTITPVSKRDQQNIHDSINLNEAEGDKSELGLSDAESGAEDVEEDEEPEYKGIKQ